MEEEDTAEIAIEDKKNNFMEIDANVENVANFKRLECIEVREFLLTYSVNRVSTNRENRELAGNKIPTGKTGN